jgi:Fur family transcriptional regulator, peroxide stress response regulator
MKATTQRIITYKALMDNGGHPTTDKIIESIQHNYPSISTGTVYRILESFVRNNLIRRVKTDKDVMRYDAVIKSHHHLYYTESEKIVDYFDDQLDALLNEYFTKKKIPNFDIDNIKVQITGKFTNKK